MSKLYFQLRKRLLERLARRHYTKKRSDSLGRRFEVTHISKRSSIKYTVLLSSSKYSSFLNIDKEKQEFLLKNKNANYEIRVISRREVNRMRRKGVSIHVLGAIDRMTPSEALEKATEFAPIASIRVTDSSVFNLQPKFEILGIKMKPSMVKAYRKPMKYKADPRPSVRRRGGISSCIKAGIDDSASHSGGICDIVMAYGMKATVEKGGGIHNPSRSNLDQLVYALEKLEKVITKIENIIDAKNHDVKNEQDEDDKLLLKLSLYFKDEETAMRFLNSVRQLKDKEIITLLKKYRDNGQCLDTSKALWEVLHKAELFKTGYTNWNAQLNKR